MLPIVSVVFVTYNRSHTLVATYETFLNIVDYPRNRLQLILADDASHHEHITIINQIEFDTRLHNSKNMGLGVTANTGMRAAIGKYILFLQDDWIITHRPSVIREAVAILEGVPDIGIVHLRNWGGPIDETGLVNGVEFEVLANRSPDGTPSRTYSDNPHLKRRDFHDVVGWYREGVPMTVMENTMNAAVSAQRVYRCARLSGSLPFVHIGDRYSFNPGKRRALAERAIAKLPGGQTALKSLRSLRRVVRQLAGHEGM